MEAAENAIDSWILPDFNDNVNWSVVGVIEWWLLCECDLKEKNDWG